MFYVDIKPTKKMGKGVFAAKDFSVGEIIEVCPIVPIPKEYMNNYDNNMVLDFLEYWFFEWDPDMQGDAMVLGYGMIYNHSSSPNAYIKYDFEKMTITFFAKENIKKGCEIFHDYRMPGRDYLEMIDLTTMKDFVVKVDKINAVDYT